MIRSNGGIESEAKNEPERLRRTPWRRLGGPWQAARRRLEALEALLGVSRGAQGGARELPGRPGGCLGVLRGALGEAFVTCGALGVGVRSETAYTWKSWNYLGFGLVFEVPRAPTACRNRAGATSESLGQPDAGP